MTLRDFENGLTPGVTLGRNGDYRQVQQWIDDGMLYAQGYPVPSAELDQLWLTDAGRKACGIWVEPVEVVVVEAVKQKELF